MNTNTQKLIFESHATSLDNERGIASGWLDTRLSEKGKEQAKDLGKRYEKKEIALVYTSDLARSFETAIIAFGHREVPIIQDSRLREWNYGKCNGHPVNEVEQYKVRCIERPFPDGESLEDVMKRFLSFAEDNLERTREGIIMIIGHRAIYYALERHYQKIPLKTIVEKPWTWQPGWSYFIS
jgi:broad specificity phosphatase PhoE